MKGKRMDTLLMMALICIALALGNWAEPDPAAASGSAQGREGRVYVDLPVLMYHSILKDPSRAGDYVLSPAQLEKDLIYLKEHGFTAISVAQLIDYVQDPFATLPEKPVLLTFDDGFYNNYVYAYPLMEKYDMCCVISIIGKYTEKTDPGAELNAMYDHLTWPLLKEMQASGRVELGNHSYNLHTIDSNRVATMRRKGESLTHYTQVLTEDTQRLQDLFEQNLGAPAYLYAYPYGRISSESKDILKELGFAATFSCEEGINHIAKGDSLSLLKRYNRPSGLTSAQFFARVFKGK